MPLFSYVFSYNLMRERRTDDVSFLPHFDVFSHIFANSENVDDKRQKKYKIKLAKSCPLAISL